MAEAIFASEKIKEFPLPKLRPRFTHPLAVVPGFTKEVFMSDGPGNGSDRNGEKQQRQELRSQGVHQPLDVVA